MISDKPIKKKVTVREIGHSIAVSIPCGICEEMNIKKGDLLSVEHEKNRIIFTLCEVKEIEN